MLLYESDLQGLIDFSSSELIWDFLLLFHLMFDKWIIKKAWKIKSRSYLTEILNILFPLIVLWGTGHGIISDIYCIKKQYTNEVPINECVIKK